MAVLSTDWNAVTATDASRLWSLTENGRVVVLPYAVESLSSCLHTHTHLFNGPLTGTTPGEPNWAGSRKVKPIWIFYWSKRQWVAVASSGPYASLHLAPTMPAPTAQFFTGQMPFLPAIQQCQSTEGMFTAMQLLWNKETYYQRYIVIIISCFASSCCLAHVNIRNGYRPKAFHWVSRLACLVDRSLARCDSQPEWKHGDIYWLTLVLPRLVKLKKRLLYVLRLCHSNRTR